MNILNKILRFIIWVTLLPFAFVMQALITILLVYFFNFVGISNQLILDRVLPFIGTLTFIYVAGIWAPSNKIKVVELLFIFELILVLLQFLLVVLGIYRLTGMETPNINSNIFGLLGGYYALTLFPVFTTDNIYMDTRMGKIAGLGGSTFFIGILILLIGLLIGFTTKAWTAFSIGIVVAVMGLITWSIPYLYSFIGILRVNNYLKKEFLNYKTSDELGNSKFTIPDNEMKGIENYVNYLYQKLISYKNYNPADTMLITDVGMKIALACYEKESASDINGKPYCDSLNAKRPDLHNGDVNFYYGFCRVVGRELANGTPENMYNLLKGVVRIKEGAIPSNHN